MTSTKSTDSFEKSSNTTKENSKEVISDEDKNIFGDSTPVGFFGLYQYSTPVERVFLFLGFILASATGVALPASALISEQFFDEISTSKFDFTLPITLYCILGGATFVCAGSYVLILETISERMLLRLKKKFFNSITRQDMAWYDMADPSRISSRVTEELSFFREGCGVKAAQMVQLSSQVLAGFLIGLIRGPILALVVIATFPAMGIVGAWFGKAMNKILVGTTEAHGEAGAVAEEALSNIRTVQALNKEEEFTHRYEKYLEKAAVYTRNGNIEFGFVLGLMYFLMFATFALGHWYAGKLVSEDMKSGDTYWSPGRALMVFMSVSIGSMSLGMISNPLKGVTKAQAALAKVILIAERQPVGIDSLSEEGSRPDKNSLRGEVKFDNIQFTFPSRADKPVYRSLSFTMPAGKTTALVGASGAGKSSAAQLLMRFYDPLSGVVSMDGINLKEINPAHWRDIVGIVAQEPKLFACSIKENITMGKPDATEVEVVAAAKAANAHDFIMQFPNGYETDVGQAGSQLSGGQKQRIAIARAIIKDPKVLILDEATSALDNQSEKIVQAALDDLMSKNPRTTLVIAHRLTTIRRADKIVVLKPSPEGSIVAEEGNHEELMGIEDGVYRRLVEAHGADKPEQPHLETVNNSLPALARKQSISQQVTQDLVRRLSSASFVLRGVGVHSSSNLMMVDDEINQDVVQQTQSTGDKGNKVIYKTNDIDPLKYSRRYLYTKSWTMIGDQWLNVAMTSLLGAIRGAVNPIYGLMMGEMMTVFFESTPDAVMNGVEKWALWVTILGAIQVPVMTLCMTCYGRVEAAITKKARMLYFSSLLYQDGEFFDAPQRTTGALITALTAHTQMFRALVGDSFVLICENTSSLVVALVVSFVVSWQMTLCMLAAYLLLIPGFAMEAKYQILDQAAEDAREAAKETGKSNSAGHLLNETVTSIRVVHALHAEYVIADKYYTRLDLGFKKGLSNAWKYALGACLSNSAMHFASAIGFGAGARFINDGITQFGDVFKVFTVMLMASQGLGMAATFAKDQIKGIAAAREVFSVSERTHPADSRRKPENAQSVDLDGAKIHFENLKFFYPTRNNSRVYNGVKFTMEPGQTTALVGASGSGKSTIVQLLQRYYTLLNGNASCFDNAIFCDGDIIIEQKNGVLVNLKDVPVSEWRSQIGVVGQEPALFKGSISNNIALGGKPDQIIPPDQILNAAQLANATEFIPRLADGIETDVGRGGSQLSGGQKQRVAIARALVRDPKLLILDEATSALDNESEKVVQAALDDLLEKQEVKRTTLVIAHRLTTIRRADKIVVFQPTREGSYICEEGRHDELMEKRGVYYKLVKAAEAIEKVTTERKSEAKEPEISAETTTN